VRESLLAHLARRHPELEDPEALVREGRVLVDGFPVRNPRSLVRRDAAVVVAEPQALRGAAKLRAALEAFPVDVDGRVALDVGAAAGGFTRVLLDAGARRVYAVDAGHGQLLGSLRQDERVVNLEATNLGELDRTLVPVPVELVTIDVSYLSLAAAVPQLERVELAPDAEVVALVKPMFELGLGRAPEDDATLESALGRACEGIAAAGWTVLGSIRSPVRGAGGSSEFLVHARYAAAGTSPS
jgi:23S rRNA (cytidine1920-2'-O)/16S rRNA (cytidine1409-2'-O)-methyltransferase